MHETSLLYLGSAVMESCGGTVDESDGTAAENAGLASLHAAARATASFRLEHHRLASCIQSGRRLWSREQPEKGAVSSTMENLAL